ncbi:MAG: hypothetical protein KBD19_02050 [Candidatus Moranbacteria bacterium]|nr:hypothetical protein [Candidatus Moranbacteria bacterium]
MSHERKQGNPRPEIRNLPTVACARMGLFLGGATIYVALENSRLLYEPKSSICGPCRNNAACREAVFGAVIIEEVICPQAGNVALSFADAKPYFGETNPICNKCSHMADCLAVS